MLLGGRRPVPATDILDSGPGFDTVEGGGIPERALYGSAVGCITDRRRSMMSKSKRRRNVSQARRVR